MCSARLNKYAVQSPSTQSDDAFQSVSFSTAAATAAASPCYVNDATTTTKMTPENTLSSVSLVERSPEKRPARPLFPPQTGFHCLNEQDVNLDYHQFNQFEEEEEGFDLDFQSSDASLIARPGNAKSGSKTSQKPAILPSVEPRPSTYQTQDEDDDDEWATVDFGKTTIADVDIGVPSSTLRAAALSSDDDFSTSFSYVVSAFRNDAAISARTTSTQISGASPSSVASGCGAFLRIFGLSGAVPLSSSASSSKAFLLAVAATPFTDENPLHPRFLKTLYFHLRPRDFSSAAVVKRFGKHWEEIGFQGVDPSTDLRGVGMLGLLCLLNCFVDEESRLLTLRVFQLSVDAVQNFPFSVMSINVTRMCLQELKAERLNREIVKAERKLLRAGGEDDAVVSVFMLFYRSLFHRLYIEWRDGKKTIADSGFVLKDLEKNWARKPSKCIKEFPLGNHAGVKDGDVGASGKKSGGGGSARKETKRKNKSRKNSSDAIGTFTNLGDL